MAQSDIVTRNNDGPENTAFELTKTLPTYTRMLPVLESRRFYEANRLSVEVVYKHLEIILVAVSTLYYTTVLYSRIAKDKPVL